MPDSPMILDLTTIKALLPKADLFHDIKQGFIAYTRKEAVIPPVGELLIPEVSGEVHIKYGYLSSIPYYVIKIASGFYQNPQLGLSSSNGLMLLFDKQTGSLLCILHDQGCLTDIRTAVAGALATKALAKPMAKTVGIIGTGIQAHLQLEYLAKIHPVAQAYVWGRNAASAEKYVADLSHLDFPIQIEKELKDLCSHADMIISTTPSQTPLLDVAWIKPGTHITAVGADTPHKTELPVELIVQADIRVTDSFSQSQSRGEMYQAQIKGLISEKDMVELGTVLEFGGVPGRDLKKISIADLTGVAVQDLMIAKAVYELALQK